MFVVEAWGKDPKTNLGAVIPIANPSVMKQLEFWFWFPEIDVDSLATVLIRTSKVSTSQTHFTHNIPCCIELCFPWLCQGPRYIEWNTSSLGSLVAQSVCSGHWNSIHCLQWLGMWKSSQHIVYCVVGHRFHHLLWIYEAPHLRDFKEGHH